MGNGVYGWANGVDYENHPMAALLDEIDGSLQEPVTGEIRNGIIVDMRPNEVLVDIGFKSEGVVSGRELERVGDTLESLNIGDEVPVFVIREDRDGNVMLSISRALAEKEWERAEDLMRSQDIFECPVDSFNRGGVIVRLGQVRGFVPASQLTSAMPTNGEDEESRYAGLKGEVLKLKVIDIDRKRNRLILSERLAMREWRRQQKDQLLETLREGAIMEGVISSIADFGAFVDLGGIDGLLHITDMSWGRINHPSEMVRIDDEIEVKVLKIDRERERIALGVKQKSASPWENITEKYPVNTRVEGEVVNLMSYGAFVKLEDGVEG
ncbi:MAG: S1 RNA-binding domain-containing protein, partial [Phycisphaerales bacterium]|nr:S1 RNA-binding domain-containing protein [Phycisphaerales bacterium]